MGLKHEEIVNGQLVHDQSDGRCYRIENVGDADRGDDNEKEYSIIDVVTNISQDDICEHSHVTSNHLSVITKEKVLLYLRYEEGDLLAEYGKTQKELNEIQLAIYELEEE